MTNKDKKIKMKNKDEKYWIKKNNEMKGEWKKKVEDREVESNEIEGIWNWNFSDMVIFFAAVK